MSTWWVLGRDVLGVRTCFEDADLLLRALDAFKIGRGDLADYVIREAALAHGCESVATFDKVLLKERAFAAP